MLSCCAYPSQASRKADKAPPLPEPPPQSSEAAEAAIRMKRFLPNRQRLGEQRQQTGHGYGKILSAATPCCIFWNLFVPWFVWAAMWRFARIIVVGYNGKDTALHNGLAKFL